jgi:hypothetical protein
VEVHASPVRRTDEHGDEGQVDDDGGDLSDVSEHERVVDRHHGDGQPDDPTRRTP